MYICFYAVSLYGVSLTDGRERLGVGKKPVHMETIWKPEKRSTPAALKLTLISPVCC